MEASAIHAPAGLARARISVSTPLLRLRSDDQLLALFRAGNDDAFRAIHDRYRQRLFAYTRQMLPGSSQDAEDALQDVFVRAYSGLRANHRELALRPWLYRVAHNRCVDELRRPLPPAPELLHQTGLPTHDPATRAEQRESLHRLITDLRRLPDQQRSALLMRELGGMTYTDVAAAMDVSVPAVKSLLVRARIGLALAVEARDTACVEIRDELTLAHDRGVRPSGTVRRHLADCGSCREFRTQVRGSRRQFAALLPALGPMGVLAKVLGIGGGGAAGGGAGAAATGGAAASGGAAATAGAAAGTGALVGGGTVASVGTFAAGATHVATLIAAAVVTAGGAVAIQHTMASPVHHRTAQHTPAVATPAAPPVAAPSGYQTRSYQAPASTPAPSSTPAKPAGVKGASTPTGGAGSTTSSTPISGGDNIVPTARPPGAAGDSTGTGAAGETPTASGTATGTDGTDTNGTGTNGTGTSGTGASGLGTTTGSGSADTGSASSGSGATDSTGTGTDGTSSTASGSTTATAAAAGTTTGTSSDTTPGSPSGT